MFETALVVLETALVMFETALTTFEAACLEVDCCFCCCCSDSLGCIQQRGLDLEENPVSLQHCGLMPKQESMLFAHAAGGV